MSADHSVEGRRTSRPGRRARGPAGVWRAAGPLGSALIALSSTGCILFDWNYEGEGGGATEAGGSGPTGGTGGAGAGGAGAGAGGVAQGGEPAGGSGGVGAAGGAGGAGGASPTCSTPGQVCVAPPAGWSGPVVLYDGPEGGVVGCPGEYPDTVFSGVGLVDEPASCAPCTCTSPSASCHGHGFTPYGDAACNANIAWSSEGLSGDACGGVTSSGVQGILVKPPTVDVPGCAPGGGTATVPPPLWTGAALMCASAAPPPPCVGGAGVCVTPPEAPLVPGMCIWHTGSVDCPAAFPDRHVLSQDQEVTDTRGCTSCTCPQTFSCKPAYHFYTGADCTGLAGTIDQYDTCTPLAMPSNISSYDVTWGSVMGSCPPAGGQPQGQIVPKAPISVCCQ